MEVKTYLYLKPEEIRNLIPYGMVTETRFGRYWGTGKRRRRWIEEFTESERNYAETLFRMAEKWYCGTGIPQEVKMTVKTLALWKKIEEFCASL